MGIKKINGILIVVSIALIIAFIGCFVYSFFNTNFNFVDTISAIASFFVAILTVITVYTTTQQMNFMKQQLDQMRNEQRLSEQPVLDIVSPTFNIERPRFFHSPREHSFQARYFFFLKINNLSSYPAIFTDVSAELVVAKDKKECILGAVSHRINVIAANSISNEIDIMFASDTSAEILSALRSASVSTLPRLRLTITYKSLSGANYVLEHTYLLDVSDNTAESSLILKNWHTSISSAPIEEKETLEILNTISSQEKHDEIFEESKKAFDAKLMGGKNLDVDMIEIPQYFSVKCVTDDVFKEITEKHQYSRYIGKHTALCKMK